MQHSTTPFGRALSPVELSGSRYLDALIAFRPETCLRMDGSDDGGDGNGGQGGDSGSKDGGGTDGGAGDGAGKDNATDAQGRDLGYPKDTPVAEMNAEQKAAYGKAKDEERRAATREWKSVTGDRTPTQLKADLDELARLRTERMTDSEKAVEQAKESARSEVLPQIAEAAFRVAIGTSKTEAEVDEFIADLNLSRFIKDGKVDAVKVLERVQQFVPAKGNDGDKQRDYGQGNRGNGQNGKSGVGAGAAMFADRHKSSTTS